MKKIFLVAIAVAALSACVQPNANAPKEDLQLKKAYSACINTAEGSPDKITACREVLNILKQDKQHQTFAEQENVRTLDYQNCLLAHKTGNAQAVEQKCNKIWQEIRTNNN